MDTGVVSPPRRILLIAGAAPQSERICDVVKVQSPDFDFARVDTQEAFECALSSVRWDLIIADFDWQRFPPLTVLALLNARGRRVPVIVVGDSIADEAANSLMQAGATDYVTKSDLQHLPTTVRRVINEAQALREREVALARAAQSEDRYRDLVDLMPIAILMVNRSGFIALANAEAHRLFRWPHGELPGIAVERLIPVRFRGRHQILRDSMPLRQGVYPMSPARDVNIIRKDGSEAAVEIMFSAVETAEGQMILAAISDVTQRKLVERELLRSREELRELSSHLVRVREEERTSIAREIHDEFGVLLTAAKIELAAMVGGLPPGRADLENRAVSLDTLIDRAADSSRQLSRRLRPAILDYGVIAAIEWQARDFSKRVGMPCEFESTVDEAVLSPEASTAVFRIFQETLTNVARHAYARHVWIGMEENLEGQLVLHVTDDGRGIEASDTEKPGSFGLISMRERARAVGATLEVRRLPEGGTEVRLCVPLEPHETSPEVSQQQELQL